MSRDITPFGLRMPADLKARIDAAAARNGRSINAECVARLQDSFDVQGQATVDVGSRPEQLLQRLLTDEDIERIAVRLAARLKAT